MILTELFTPETYHPTQHERAVLSLCIISDTAQLADAQTNKTQQLVFAKNNLLKLGLLSGEPGLIKLTDAGRIVCNQQALSDELGQQTEHATQLASEYS